MGGLVCPKVNSVQVLALAKAGAEHSNIIFVKDHLVPLINMFPCLKVSQVLRGEFALHFEDRLNFFGEYKSE